MAKSAQKKKPDRYVRDSGLMEKQVTIDGKRKVFRGHSEREINEKMLSYQTEQAAGPMLSDVAERWWAQKEATLRPGTVRCHKRPGCGRSSAERAAERLPAARWLPLS